MLDTVHVLCDNISFHNWTQMCWVVAFGDFLDSPQSVWLSGQSTWWIWQVQSVSTATLWYSYSAGLKLPLRLSARTSQFYEPWRTSSKTPTITPTVWGPAGPASIGVLSPSAMTRGTQVSSWRSCTPASWVTCGRSSELLPWHNR